MTWNWLKKYIRSNFRIQTWPNKFQAKMDYWVGIGFEHPINHCQTGKGHLSSVWILHSQS